MDQKKERNGGSAEERGSKGQLGGKWRGEEEEAGIEVNVRPLFPSMWDHNNQSFKSSAGDRKFRGYVYLTEEKTARKDKVNDPNPNPSAVSM